MGAADVVPGVSGGTMAFILGIYTQLIEAIKSFDTTWLLAVVKFDLRTSFTRPHFLFLLPLGLGIVCAVLFFTRIVPIPSLLHTHPEAIYGLFFGLIVGSTIILLREIKSKSLIDFSAILAGIILGALVVTAVPTQTPDHWWVIMGSGALAICAMVLPGISGSFILLILGKYGTVLDGIGKFDVEIILPFAIGAAIGLSAFTRLLSWLMHRYERIMLLLISGFLLASLWVIWPFQQREYVMVRDKQRLLESLPVAPAWEPSTVHAIGLAVLGLLLVMSVSHIATRQTSLPK
ncbi:MAG: putative membrane protein [Gammaproteobacteria bacterium]|jgi:putative membrane protein